MTNTDFKRVTQLEGGVLTLTWPFPENLTSPSSIVGAVITGTMQNIRTGDDDVTAITGTLTAVSATTFTWDMSAEDSGTAGTFLVIFRAVVSGVPTYTLAGTLVVDVNPAVTAVAAPPLVGIDADDAAWAAAGRATVPDATDLVSQDDLGTAAYEDTTAFDAAGAAALMVPLAGGTMTGALVLSGAPTVDLHAATKKYVDDNAGSGGDFLADGSVPMTGPLELNPGADDAAKSWFIPITSADNANINFNVAKTVFEDVDDVTFNLGFNNSGGGREDGTKPALYLQFENRYKTGANEWFEYHLNVVSAGGTVVRPFEYKYERDATQGTATYVASTYTWTAFNGYNAMQMQTNGTLAGTQITFAGAFTMSGAGTQAFVTNGPLYVKSPDTTKGVAIVADNAGNTVFARQGASGNIQFTNWATMEVPGAALYPTAWTVVVPITMGDAKNLIFNTTTGTKIGTATGQKIGFWNATPVVQQVLATGAGATADNIISLLQTLGLCKQS